MERLAKFVSSRGLAKKCDSHNAVVRSGFSQIDRDLLAGHMPGGSVYLCTDAVLTFIDHLLSTIQDDFVLVTGDSDTAITQLIVDHPKLAPLVNSPHLVAWYAQNLMAKHPKLHQMPIGMDYHTMWQRPGVWGMVEQSPIAQEHALIGVFSRSRPFRSRHFVGYCNWHFAGDRGDRVACMQKIQRERCFVEDDRLPRLVSWQRQAECMFVISPEGAGIDCHRTWEALLLGCVPVVKRSQFSSLFADLPVLVLDEWEQFNEAHMRQSLPIFFQKRFNFSSLFLSYWSDCIKQKVPLRLDDMTMDEFRTLVCGMSY
jgi:hypothetical protein